jgi:FeS assembly SUF system regulator
MLRMSKLADYGTVVMTTLALEPLRIHNTAEVAARVGLAPPTVSKILKRLAHEGLVESLLGAKGGYRLARPAAQISLAAVICAMDGPIGMTECSTTPGMCSQEGGCNVRANWKKINRLVLGVLEGVTLEQMTQPISRTVGADTIKRGAARAIA